MQRERLNSATPNAIAASGTYYIRGTTASGYSDIQPVVVTINAQPTVTITNPAAICAPATVDITAAAITAGSTAGLTYTYFTDAAGTIVLGNTERNSSERNLLYQGNNSIRLLRYTTRGSNDQRTANSYHNEPCCSMRTCNSGHHGSSSNSGINSRINLYLLYGCCRNDRSGISERNSCERNLLYQRNESTRMLRYTTRSSHDQRTANSYHHEPCCGVRTGNGGHHGSSSNSGINSRINLYLLHGCSRNDRSRNTERSSSKRNLLYQGNDSIRMLRYTTRSSHDQRTANSYITNPAAVCAPGTVDITAAAITAGSTAGLTYTYFTDAAGTIVLATPNAIAVSGTYYIRGTTASGCSDIQPVVVTINAQPTVIITNPAAVCAPATVDITAAAITAGSTAGLTYTYFTDAAGTIVLASPNAVAASGTYYIRGTTASGCSDIQPVVVTINAQPTVTITNPAAVCAPEQWT